MNILKKLYNRLLPEGLRNYFFNQRQASPIFNPHIKGHQTIRLSAEFDKFWSMIERGENFAFMRNADGERAIMMGKAVAAQEGNWKSPPYVSQLGKAIQASLEIEDKQAWYAVSCPCCDPEAYYWYSSRVKSRMTFANLWINCKALDHHLFKF